MPAAIPINADYGAKRRILEIVCLNCTLDGAILVPTMRTPFNVVAEGLRSEKSRDDRTSIELFSGSFGDWTKSLIAIAQALAS